MIPVDAAIWKESDVRRDGMSIESVLDAMKEQGACAKLVVIDASRRNPYERRFRAFSHGLAPINAPDNALILSSATPGKVADDSKGQHSVLMAELLNNINRAASWRAASKPSSTRPASRSPAPPTASRCPRCRRRCWKTSSSAPAHRQGRRCTSYLPSFRRVEDANLMSCTRTRRFRRAGMTKAICVPRLSSSSPLPPAKRCGRDQGWGVLQRIPRSEFCR